MYRHGFFLAFLAHAVLSGAKSVPPARRRRSLGEMHAMLRCAITDQLEDREPADYDGYGCFCGGEGTGGYPRDSIDRCCRARENCVKKVKLLPNCPPRLVAGMPYTRTSCLGCEPAYVYWAYPECRADLCVCDSLAVQCITEANEFHEEYKAENFVRGLDCDYKKY